MRLIDADEIGLSDFEIIMCDGNYKEALSMLINKIKDAPSIEVETVTEFADRCRECGSKYGKLLKQEQETGHWIVYDHGYGIKFYQCSNCKGFDGGEKGKYCKWCGKKMIELQKGTVSE